MWAAAAERATSIRGLLDSYTTGQQGAIWKNYISGGAGPKESPTKMQGGQFINPGWGSLLSRPLAPCFSLRTRADGRIEAREVHVVHLQGVLPSVGLLLGRDRSSYKSMAPRGRKNMIGTVPSTYDP